MEWLDLGAEIVAFRRGRLTSVTNFGDNEVPMPPGRQLLASEDLGDSLLVPDATVWLESN